MTPEDTATVTALRAAMAAETHGRHLDPAGVADRVEPPDPRRVEGRGWPRWF